MVKTGRPGQPWERRTAAGNWTVFLLKFMSFSRRVLYLISALGFQGHAHHAHTTEASCFGGRDVPPLSPRPPGRWKDAGPLQLPVTPSSSWVVPPASGGGGSLSGKLVCVAMAATLTHCLVRRVRAAVARCGFATERVAGPGPTGREPDPDSDWEPEERELQELERYRFL